MKASTNFVNDIKEGRLHNNFRYLELWNMKLFNWKVDWI